eukprot:6572553-Pyramimonas_sp.AAC.1
MVNVELLSSIAMTKEHIGMVKELVMMQSSLGHWIKAHRERFVYINNGWWADALFAEMCLDLVAKAVKQATDQITGHLKDMGDRVTQCSITSTALHNPQMLVSEELQATLFNNPKKAELSDAVVELGAAINLVTTDLAQANNKALDEALDKVKKSRRHGKSCIGM